MTAPQRQAKPRGAFSAAVVIGLICVGVFSFSAFFALSAFAPDLSAGSQGGAHALSRSADGYAAIVRLLRELHEPVSVGRVVGDTERRRALVILTPPSPLSWDDLRTAGGRATLIVLPKWQTGPDQFHRGWAARFGVYEPRMLTAFLSQLSPRAQVTRVGATAPVEARFADFTLTSGPIASLQTMSSPDFAPVVEDAAGNMLLAEMLRNGRNTGVFILSDPDFLNTQGVANLDTARAGVAMLNTLRRGQTPMVFDVTLNGVGGARSALRLAFTPPFLGFTLGFALAALLLSWRAALRFGPAAAATRAIAFGKTTLADNAAALLRLGRRERSIAHGYASVVVAQCARELGMPRQDEARTLASVDRATAMKGASVALSELYRETALVKSPSTLLAFARKLYAWKRENIRATR